MAGVVRRYIDPHLGGMRLSTIQPADVQRWVKHLSGTLAPSTVGVAHRILSGILKSAVADRRDRLQRVHRHQAAQGHQTQGPADHRGPARRHRRAHAPATSGTGHPGRRHRAASGRDLRPHRRPRSTSSGGPSSSTGSSSTSTAANRSSGHPSRRPASASSRYRRSSPTPSGRTCRPTPRPRSSSRTTSAPPAPVAFWTEWNRALKQAGVPAIRSTSCGTTTPRCSSVTASRSRPSRPVWATPAPARPSTPTATSGPTTTSARGPPSTESSEILRTILRTNGGDRNTSPQVRGLKVDESADTPGSVPRPRYR